jgi:hypothetical protein
VGPYVFLDPALVPGQADELQQGRGVRLADVGRQGPQLVGPEAGDDGDIERGDPLRQAPRVPAGTPA